ncbi:MAG: Uma2 family endonuclease [Pacificimonas sp.]
MNQPVLLEEWEEIPLKLTVDNFLEIIESGALDQAGKLELVDGRIVRMNTAQNVHVMTQRQVFRKLDAIFGDGLDGYIVVQEPSYRLDDYNIRDPDVTIMKEPDLTRAINAPDMLLLAVEIADSSLARDRGPKRLAYAAAGFPHYWIVDTQGRQVEIYTDPSDGDYRTKTTVAFGTAIAVPGADKDITIE